MIGFFYSGLNSTGGNTTGIAFRTRIEFFDEKLNPVTPTADFILSPGNKVKSVGATFIQAGVNISDAQIQIKQEAIAAGAKFARVGWFASNPLVATTAILLSVVHYSKLSDYSSGALSQVAKANAHIVSAVPAHGYAPLGYIASRVHGDYQYINRAAITTTLSTVASSGATNVVLASANNVIGGDVIGINLSDNSTHWAKVVSVSSNTVTIDAATTQSATVGSKVYINRWQQLGLMAQAETQVASTAANLDSLKNDFNSLISKLRVAKLML